MSSPPPPPAAGSATSTPPPSAATAAPRAMPLYPRPPQANAHAHQHQYPQHNLYPPPTKSTEETPALAFAEQAQRYNRQFQGILDRITPYSLYRWCGTGALLVLFALRVVLGGGVSVCFLFLCQREVADVGDGAARSLVSSRQSRAFSPISGDALAGVPPLPSSCPLVPPAAFLGVESACSLFSQKLTFVCCISSRQWYIGARSVRLLAGWLAQLARRVSSLTFPPYFADVFLSLCSRLYVLMALEVSSRDFRSPPPFA